MGIFSLNIERYYQELADKGEQLLGIFNVQYPIYCIHANITDITPDPLDDLDKVITSFYSKKSSYTSSQIGALIGASPSLIDIRVNKLIRDGYLEGSKNIYTLTDEGTNVFINKTLQREHKRSHDFYLDGVTLNPLPRVFYSFYRSKFISEYDSYYRTTKKRRTIQVKPFGPDLVHTPPENSVIIDKIFNAKIVDSDYYAIPTGLVNVNEIAFTKLTFQLLISVSKSKNEDISKEVIDGFANYSIGDNESYYDSLKKNIKIFENNLTEKVRNLVFKIDFSKQNENSSEELKPRIVSNWPEIDKYNNSHDKCFSFSSGDLICVINQIFKINDVVAESVINEEKSIEISINERMLLESTNRKKLIDNLIRERDYELGYIDNNVFLMYLYFKTGDSFVQDALNFKKLRSEIKNKSLMNLDWINKNCPQYKDNYRKLLIASGDYDVLEKLDTENFMVKLD